MISESQFLLGKEIPKEIDDGLFFRVPEFAGIEKHPEATRTSLVPDVGPSRVDHFWHGYAAMGTIRRLAPFLDPGNQPCHRPDIGLVETA
jgi:hypothetical protein